MKLLYLIVLVFFISLTIGCDSHTQAFEASNVASLQNNTEWPYAIEGELDFVEVSGWDDDYQYFTWATGFLDAGNIEEEILVSWMVMPPLKPTTMWILAEKSKCG